MHACTIADRIIGPGQPVFIIAEIGYNFTNLKEACASIDAAVECGVDAVKFQTFRADTVTSRYTSFPQEAGSSNQYDEFKQYEISEEAHRILFDYAEKAGVLAFSTPSHYEDVSLLERLKVAAYKLGSDDLTNLPFIAHVALLGKPLIFSTGMGSQAEVALAFETAWRTGNHNLAILHCLSNYPIVDMSHLNLRAIATFRRMFPVPIGFSDHTTSTVAAIAATALGACIIERHFTLDKNMPVPDAFFSTDPGEMQNLVAAVRATESALGDGVKKPAPSEEAMRRETRKSVIARRALAPGQTIHQGDLIVKRPGTGIQPALAHLVPGRSARHAIEEDQPITWEMLH